MPPRIGLFRHLIFGAVLCAALNCITAFSVKHHLNLEQEQTLLEQHLDKVSPSANAQHEITVQAIERVPALELTSEVLAFDSHLELALRAVGETNGESLSVRDAAVSPYDWLTASSLHAAHLLKSSIWITGQGAGIESARCSG